MEGNFFSPGVLATGDVVGVEFHRRGDRAPQSTGRLRRFTPRCARDASISRNAPGGGEVTQTGEQPALPVRPWCMRLLGPSCQPKLGNAPRRPRLVRGDIALGASLCLSCLRLPLSRSLDSVRLNLTYL